MYCKFRYYNCTAEMEKDILVDLEISGVVSDSEHLIAVFMVV